MSEELKLASLSSVSVRTEALFEPRVVWLPEILAFSNAAPALRQKWGGAYAARSAKAAAVSLEKLPSGAMLCGTTFLLFAEETAVLEQYLPVLHTDLAELYRNAVARPAIPVNGEVLCISRYGEGTWGHWLVELLPKVAVAERAWPNRFSYTMPAWVLSGGLRERMLESLAAYGVGLERLILLEKDKAYAFQSLFGLTPVWSDFVLHPEVGAIMDDVTRISPVAEFAATPKVALLRSDHRRDVTNAPELHAYLRQHRFTILDIASLPFLQQVALFKSGKTVFSILGSSLAGLIYANAGTRVVAAAPEAFGDRFFYSILQAKPGACWAEARGPVDEKDERFYRDSSFHVPLDLLGEALHNLGV